MNATVSSRVSYSLIERMPAHRLKMNHRARVSVCWAMRIKTRRPQSFISLRVGDVARLTRFELAIVPGCGPKTVAHVEERLASLGLTFSQEEDL